MVGREDTRKCHNDAVCLFYHTLVALCYIYMGWGPVAYYNYSSQGGT